MKCWHCHYPVERDWRYCPSCGLWMSDAPPIRTIWRDGQVIMQIVEIRDTTAEQVRQ